MINSRTFKLHLKNSRDKKDIHVFSKALLAMDQFVGKDQGSKYVYMHIGKEGKVSIGSAIANIWQYSPGNVEQGIFFMKFKESIVKVTEKNFEDMIVCLPLKQIQSFFDQKVEAKMTNITLIFEKFRVICDFLTNQFFKGHMQTNYFNFRGEYDDNYNEDIKWPMDRQVLEPSQTKKVIRLFALPPETGRHIQLTHNIYVKFEDKRLLFQTEADGSIWTTKIKDDEIKGYDYQMVKREFQNKEFMYIQSLNFMKHIKHCAKNRVCCQFKLVIFYQKHDPTRIMRTHLILDSPSQKAQEMYKIFLVYLTDNLQSRRQPEKETALHQTQQKTNSYGIKKQKIVINKYSNQQNKMPIQTQEKVKIQPSSSFSKIEYEERTVKKM